MREDQPTIIGITGHAHDKYKKEGFEAGMDRVEIKPCYFSIIDDIVKELQLKWNKNVRTEDLNIIIKRFNKNVLE